MSLRRRFLAAILARTGRALCALAVAIVTTFHVCDIASARSIDILSEIVAESDQTNTTDIVAVEKCHVCSAVHLLAAEIPWSVEELVHLVPYGRIEPLTSISQPYTGPPPRT
jgi:hypothetical protein